MTVYCRKKGGKQMIIQPGNSKASFENDFFPPVANTCTNSKITVCHH